MSEETKATGEEPLAISNEFFGCGGANKDALCIAEAIYALAREVRELRKVTSLEVANALDNINDAISSIDIPSYDGAMQVEIVRGGE